MPVSYTHLDVYKRQQLAPALLLMLQRQRLTRWGLGLMVNALWALAMLAALVTLLLLLATRRYGFVWETTILGGDTFIALTDVYKRQVRRHARRSCAR